LTLLFLTIGLIQRSILEGECKGHRGWTRLKPAPVSISIALSSLIARSIATVFRVENPARPPRGLDGPARRQRMATDMNRKLRRPDFATRSVHSPRRKYGPWRAISTSTNGIVAFSPRGRLGAGGRDRIERWRSSLYGEVPFIMINLKKRPGWAGSWSAWPWPGWP
jgi:hypothetical protein